jgi:hypothetical protein
MLRFLLAPACAAIVSGAAAAIPPAFLASFAPTDPDLDERFGFVVDIEGDLMIVGAYGDRVAGAQFRGSASVFRRAADGTWAFEQKLVAPDGAAFDQFGFAVAIAGEGDGRSVIVAAPRGPGPQHPDQGAAYVFERIAGAWSSTTKLLLPIGANNDTFGYSASADGDVVAIGAVFDDAPLANQGSVAVFRRSGSAWVFEAALLAPDAAVEDRFGFDVAVDGPRILVGANHDDVLGMVDRGSAHLFAHDGSSWQHRRQFTAAAGSTGNFFATSVDLDGDLAVFGSIFDAPGGLAKRGSATLFRGGDASWQELATIVPTDSSAGDECGVAVAVDAGLVAIGGFKHDVAGATDAGRAWAFHVADDDSIAPAWSVTAPGPSTGDNFANVLHLEGGLLAVGAFATDDVAVNEGALHLFTLASPCPADLDANGSVDAADLAVLLGAWGGTGAPDLDASGAVDAADLAVLLGAWGDC